MNNNPNNSYSENNEFANTRGLTSEQINHIIGVLNSGTLDFSLREGFPNPGDGEEASSSTGRGERIIKPVDIINTLCDSEDLDDSSSEKIRAVFPSDLSDQSNDNSSHNIQYEDVRESLPISSLSRERQVVSEENEILAQQESQVVSEENKILAQQESQVVSEEEADLIEFEIMKERLDSFISTLEEVGPPTRSSKELDSTQIKGQHSDEVLEDLQNQSSSQIVCNTDNHLINTAQNNRKDQEQKQKNDTPKQANNLQGLMECSRYPDAKPRLIPGNFVVDIILLLFLVGANYFSGKYFENKEKSKFAKLKEKKKTR